MQICGKHDVAFADGGECWCCEEVKLDTPEKRNAAYRDPAFLKKRGGLDVGAAARSAVLDRLSSLKPEEIDKLLALAGAAPQSGAGGGTRRVVA